MRVHWGRAPGKVAIMTIVDNENYYGHGSGNDTGHDNGNNIYLGLPVAMIIIMAMTMT